MYLTDTLCPLQAAVFAVAFAMDFLEPGVAWQMPLGLHRTVGSPVVSRAMRRQLVTIICSLVPEPPLPYIINPYLVSMSL